MAFEDGDFPGYVSAAERRRRIAAALRDLERRGLAPSPVEIPGRELATTFWGRAWCEHVEGLADLATRLPRGRSYVRTGAVVDLRIEPGAVRALVSGTELYEATIRIAPLQRKRWEAVRRASTGRIANLVDLLAGRLPDAVLEVLADREHGLFPRSAELELSCSCPDGARLCKHLAAVLYGVGARLDRAPELLFVLRGVDAEELVLEANDAASRVAGGPAASRTTAEALPRETLGPIFGIELEAEGAKVVLPGADARRRPVAKRGGSRRRVGARPSRRVGHPAPRKR